MRDIQGQNYKFSLKELIKHEEKAENKLKKAFHR